MSEMEKKEEIEKKDDDNDVLGNEQEWEGIKSGDSTYELIQARCYDDSLLTRLSHTKPSNTTT